MSTFLIGFAVESKGHNQYCAINKQSQQLTRMSPHPLVRLAENGTHRETPMVDGVVTKAGAA